MSRYLLTFAFSALALPFFAQQPQTPAVKKDGWKNTREGNQYFKKQQYALAEEHYRTALEKDTSKATASYNLGNALYNQKKYSDAERAYADATAGTNADSLSRSWHNLGNAMLQQNKYQESINAYKQALKLKPNDEDTRYNLAYAQSKLKKQQPPPKNKNQKQQNNSKQKQQPQNSKPNQKNQKNQQKPDQKQDQSMRPDEAQRMLDAMKDREKKTRQRMNNQKNKDFKRSKDKDW